MRVKRIGLVVPFSDERPFISADHKHLLRSLADGASGLLEIVAIDVFSLSADGTVAGIAYNGNEECALDRYRVAQFDLIHCLDFYHGSETTLTIDEKWNRITAYLNAIANEHVPMLNTLEAMRVYMDKSYLMELQSMGLPVMKTEIIPSGALKTFKDTSFLTVVKPLLGESGKLVYTSDHIDDRVIRMFQKQCAHVIVQPFYPEVSSGEWSLIFIGGEYSHGVVKSQVQHGSEPIMRAITPTASDFLFSDKVIGAMSIVPDIFRIDFIRVEDKPLLMEIEAVDPYHYAQFEDSTYHGRLIGLYLSKCKSIKYA
jgi:hypothetical protein